MGMPTGRRHWLITVDERNDQHRVDVRPLRLSALLDAAQARRAWGKLPQEPTIGGHVLAYDCGIPKRWPRSTWRALDAAAAPVQSAC
ncbi:MAG TPA: hypothetical protein VFZ66_15545 [Herpetosiphonaceae bacterium]